MNNKFDELTKSLAQSVTRGAAPTKLGLGLMVLALAGLLAWPAAGANPASTIYVIDPAGDAIFPQDLYSSAIAPSYLDAIESSVSLTRGVFHFEIKMSVEVRANADPGVTPSVNHLGGTFGILTDPKTAGHYKFFGQQDNHAFNFLVGLSIPCRILG